MVQIKRRDVLQVCAGVAVGLAGTQIAREIAKNSLRDFSEKTYGRLDEPKFLVDERAIFTRHSNYQQSLFSKYPDLKPSEYKTISDKLDEMKKDLDRLDELTKKHGSFNLVQDRSEQLTDEDRLVELLKVKDPEILEGERLYSLLGSNIAIIEVQLLLKNGSLSEKEFKANITDIYAKEFMKLTSSMSYVDQQDKYGKPEALLKKMIKDLTGRELPDEVTFETRAIDKEGTAGYSNFVKQLSVSEDGHYGSVLAVHAHEAGHLISLHQEEMVLHNSGMSEVEMAIFEEACAYAFEFVVAHSVKDQELSKMIKVICDLERSYLLDEYYSGKNSNECHRLGMAYFDAALTALGSPAKAYNYLATHTELTPAMHSIIEKNKQLSKLVQEGRTPKLDEVNKEFAKINSRFQALVN